MTVWFITRSYPPQKGGGPQMRELQVDFLRKKYDVKVITINHDSNELIEKNDIIYIPYTTNRYLKELYKVFEIFGIVKDALNIWINNSVKYLKNKIKSGDIVFATTGGELGSMLIGYELKQINSSVKYIINYHDLLDYGIYENERVCKEFHIKIDSIEKKCLDISDFILTNSDIMTEIIQKKFPFVCNKVDKLYFGFKRVDLSKYNIKHNINGKICIANIGSASKWQSPDILIRAFKLLPDDIKEHIELLFIGDSKFNKSIRNEFKCYDYIDREELIPFVLNNVDFAFVSLVNIKPFRPAMPTKFFEYIGLNLPIIAALPEDSEATRNIQKYQIGLVCTHGNIEDLKNILIKLVKEKGLIDRFQKNILINKNIFDSTTTLNEMYKTIER